MKKIEISTSKFISFLINARLNTWVGEGRKIREDDYSRNYYYNEKDFEYKDQYFGNLVDGGREVVFFKNRPLWIMCYHGGILKEYDGLSTDVFAFLRKALLFPPPEYPVRGPASFSNQELTYKNSFFGDLYFFHGIEKIISKDVEVYRRMYVGGEIRDREYQLVLLEG